MPATPMGERVKGEATATDKPPYCISFHNFVFFKIRYCNVHTSTYYTLILL